MANAASIELTGLEELIVRLGELDRGGALAVVDRALARGATLDQVITGLLAPALVDLGRLWAAHDLGPVEAQAATAIVRMALYRAAPPAGSSERPVVAVGSPEGERHELPAEMVTESLRAHGWPAESIGVPASGLRDYLERRRPVAVLLSCTTPCGLAGAARAIDVAHHCGVGVIVGGAAFGRDDLRALRLGAGGWAPTATAATTILTRWQVKPPDMPLGRALSDNFLALESALPQVRGTAFDALRRSALRRSQDTAELAILRDRLDLVLAHLGAAILLDDGGLFLDFLAWQLAFFKVSDVAGMRLGQTLEALSMALPRSHTGAQRLLERGYHYVHRGDPSRQSKALAGAAPSATSAEVGAPAAPHSPVPAARARTGSAPPARGTAVFSVGSVAGPDVAQGQVFADLLFLAAMSCHAPIALIAVAQAEGQWSTLSYGVDRREVLSDPGLFAAVAAAPDALEIPALAGHPELGGSPLASGPLAVRFVYGVPLRSRQGNTVGVFCVLDRRSREMGGREQQAVMAIARQVAGQLALWRRTAPPTSAPVPAPAGERRRDPHRKGPDAALADLVGLRRAGFGVEQHLLRSHEVAVLFDVTERTVINWAAAQKLSSLRTAGGHLRFRSDDVLALLDKRAGSATG